MGLFCVWNCLNWTSLFEWGGSILKTWSGVYLLNWNELNWNGCQAKPRWIFGLLVNLSQCFVFVVFYLTEVFLLVKVCRTCELSLDGGLMLNMELWVCILYLHWITSGYVFTAWFLHGVCPKQKVNLNRSKYYSCVAFAVILLPPREHHIPSSQGYSLTMCRCLG